MLFLFDLYCVVNKLPTYLHILHISLVKTYSHAELSRMTVEYPTFSVDEIV